MVRDTLMRLTQLETLDLKLSHLSGLQQLPPHVTSLRLHAQELLDMAMAPCLQSCPGLQRLELSSEHGVHGHAVALERPSNFN